MKQRIITAIVAAAFFIPFVIYGRWPFALLVYAMATVALYELLRMGKQSFFSFGGLLSVLLLWLILFPSKYMHVIAQTGFSKLELVYMIVLLFLAYMVVTKNRFTFEQAGFHILSAIYVGIGFYYFIETRNAPDAGITYIFYALFLIWATDSGAYFVGRAFGKHKLWPEISPNKTVEGALGGVLCAVIVAVLFFFYSNIGLGLGRLMVSTVVLSVFGQIGDLVESAYKRHYGVKDAGKILPGHGGILDRFDSLLFVLPLIHFLKMMAG
ncbi:phosphatidate cytidylyltransferase [Weizmannia coagulans]|jgi:phosphatidate cytidylyltransferase|uniref:Phosphatidate cytidylyltransferase n=3 Tax=Heyndrickxia TaxID=2837504 RepID=G2TJH7_HEYCO|nr:MULTISPECIES: phosphatidate cytidylyltransferase [Heyndrickxia]AEO99248.1 phosphatidate cytidylyltransferase [Heyndrickxia coagulans 36D1]AJO23320.1 phosphatidate cytidylyltransferase [Heyndrickxia coagulans]AKN55179.1 Phosphatidate cytidylyltransferase [Heyndrickxia coagulans]ATW83461.1 phosphatidate cytidylyltransferase [Heyndrickxia coagulans]AWP36776.1 phosphatidate cytidylyltransferase [Heyndrickxia coagulans]